MTSFSSDKYFSSLIFISREIHTDQGEVGSPEGLPERHSSLRGIRWGPGLVGFRRVPDTQTSHEGLHQVPGTRQVLFETFC